MKRAEFAGVALAVILAMTARPALPAQIAVSDADRTYHNFTREAATVGSDVARIEVRGLAIHDGAEPRLNLIGKPIDEHLTNAEGAQADVQRLGGGLVDLIGSYGLGSTTETGFVVPFVFENATVVRHHTDPITHATTTDPPSRERRTDIGDVRLYGKFKRSVATHCAAAGGVELSLPTGSEERTFGNGEIGVTPFASTRYQQGRIALGINAGYQILTGGQLDDTFEYGAEAIFRVLPAAAVRAEIAGRRFQIRGVRYDDVTLLPGVDFNLGEAVTVRPAGMVGLTNEAMNWGFGASVAFQR